MDTLNKRTDLQCCISNLYKRYNFLGDGAGALQYRTGPEIAGSVDSKREEALHFTLSKKTILTFNARTD